MKPKATAQAAAPKPFLPSRRAAAIIAALGLAALAAALWLRYGVIQNSGIGIACEAGEESLICTLRLAAILMFARGLLGWIALAAALLQLWRPNVVAFGIGLIFALLGLVLYNTRVSALAAGLLVLSLARPSSGAGPRQRAGAGR
jgi:Gpi18-like mannosyltransferase